MFERLFKTLSPNTRLLTKNIMSTLVLRVVNFGISALMVPLTVSGLNVDDYAFLAIIVSVSIVFSYADLGLGLSIVNKVAETKEHQKDGSTKTTISNTYVFLSLVSATIFLIALAAVGVMDLGNRLEWMVLIAASTLGIPASLVHRLLFATQRSFEANFWYALGRGGALLGVFVCSTHSFPLWAYVASVLGVPVVVNIAATLAFFYRNPRWIPSTSDLKWGDLPAQMTLGWAFLLLQVSIYAEVGIDVVILSARYGAELIRQYDVLQKLYTYVPALVSVAIFPAWPAFRRARADQDMEWVRLIGRRMAVAVGVVSAAFSLCVFWYHKELVDMWTGIDIDVSIQVVMLMACFSVMTSLNTVQSIMMNSLDLVLVQARISIYFIIVVVATKYLAVIWFGVEGMLAAFCVVFAARMLIYQSIISKRMVDENG